MRDERDSTFTPSVDDAFLAPPIEGTIPVTEAAADTWGWGSCVRGGSVSLDEIIVEEIWMG